MDEYELAKAYSWDLASSLKLVRVEMHMKLQEFNDRILHAIHTVDIENFEKFQNELFKREPDKNSLGDLELGDLYGENSEGFEEEGLSEREGKKGPEVLDEMKDREVDYLDLIMPNLSRLPNIEQDGQMQKKVQFSVSGRKTVSFLDRSYCCGFVIL